jgi:hypothetical protein
MIKLTYQLYLKAGYKKSDASKLNKFFKSQNILTLADLENSPPRLGTRVLGHDVYQLIYAVAQAANLPEPAKEKKELDNGEESHQTKSTSS